MEITKKEKISVGARGKASELRACTYFFDQGYEVFMALNPYSSVDFIIAKDGVSVGRSPHWLPEAKIQTHVDM